jgi:hypothetical protein
LIKRYADNKASYYSIVVIIITIPGWGLVELHYHDPPRLRLLGLTCQSWYHGCSRHPRFPTRSRSALAAPLARIRRRCPEIWRSCPERNRLPQKFDRNRPPQNPGFEERSVITSQDRPIHPNLKLCISVITPRNLLTSLLYCMVGVSALGSLFLKPRLQAFIFCFLSFYYMLQV